MSNTPAWLHGLIWDTAVWAGGACQVFGSFVGVDITQYRMLPVALVSGAEHELDYYTDAEPPWTIETVSAYWHRLWEGRK